MLTHGDIFRRHWMRGDPKMVEYSILSKMSDTTYVQICCVCKFPTSWVVLKRWAIFILFGPHLTPRVPQSNCIF